MAPGQVVHLWIRNVKAEDYIGEQVETEKIPKKRAEAASRLLKLQNLREQIVFGPIGVLSAESMMDYPILNTASHTGTRHN